MTHRVRYRPAPRARIVQRVIVGTGAPALSFYSAALRGGWGQGRESGRHKALCDYDTSLILTGKGPVT